MHEQIKPITHVTTSCAECVGLVIPFGKHKINGEKS